MLKRKLHKASFVTMSFVLIAASSGSKPIDNRPGDGDSTLASSHTPKQGAMLPLHAFDSAGICTCLHNLAIMDLADAPRIQLNGQATRFVTDHLKKNSAGLADIKTKNARYFELIDTVFTRHQLPVELKYLAVIESKLNTRAVSRVGAKGMWQFMPSTARLFGLKVKGKYDERIYAFKSTVAAAKYLSYLYRLFDDWLLTIAAYNSGPGYVYAAIKKSGSRNFWALQNFLPKETRNHVKKFIGTHYYYEGHGSLTTLTKAERNAHIDAVAAYAEKQKEIASHMATDTVITTITNETVKLEQ